LSAVIPSSLCISIIAVLLWWRPQSFDAAATAEALLLHACCRAAAVVAHAKAQHLGPSSVATKGVLQAHAFTVAVHVNLQPGCFTCMLWLIICVLLRAAHPPVAGGGSGDLAVRVYASRYRDLPGSTI
jgi:hypothetical protein